MAPVSVCKSTKNYVFAKVIFWKNAMLSQLCLCVIVKKQSCCDWDCNFVARLHKAFDGKVRLYNCNCMQLSFDWIHFIQLSISMVRVKINSNRNLKKDKEKPHKGYVYKLDRQQTMMLRFDQSQLLVWEYPSPQPLITSDQWSQKGRRMHAWRFLSQDLFAYLT